MDAGGYDAGEIRGNLADLRAYNRWFGGSRLVAREISRMLKGSAGLPGQLRILDVATGSGDVPAYLARWAASKGLEILAEGLDANADMHHEARTFLDGLSGSAARSAAARSVRLLRADALRLPHADGAIDIATCSNFLHHLDGPDAVLALREMKRVSRVGVIVVDLKRDTTAFAAVWAVTRLTTRNRLTRADGPLSVKRAFTPAEMASLARQAGMAGAVVMSDSPIRMVLKWSRT